MKMTGTRWLSIAMVGVGFLMFAGILAPLATVTSNTNSTFGFWTYCGLDTRTNAQYPPTSGTLTTASICSALYGYLVLGSGLSGISSATMIYCSVAGTGTCTPVSGNSLTVSALLYDSSSNVQMYYLSTTLPTMAIGYSYTYKLTVVDATGTYSATATIAVVNVNTLISFTDYYILNGGTPAAFTSSSNINVKPSDSVVFVVDVTGGLTYVTGMSALCSTTNYPTSGTCPGGTYTSTITGSTGTCPTGTVSGTCYITPAVSFPIGGSNAPGVYTLNGYLSTTVSGQGSLLVFSILGVGNGSSVLSLNANQFVGIALMAVGGFVYFRKRR